MLLPLTANWSIFQKQYNLLRGNCTPNQKLACFALYLKTVNTFVQNNVYILKQIVLKLRNGNGILVAQADFKLWINTVKILF